MKKKTKLIVLEGCDASGKSTQIKLILNFLKENNIKHDFIHFPAYGNNEASKIIELYLRGEFGNINEVNPIFIASIYALDRYLYLPIIRKKLFENDVIILDRYVFSNMAYQGAKYENETQSELIKKWIYNLEFKFLELPYPDLNIFFDVPIDFIKEKLIINKREGEDRHYLNGKNDIHEMDIKFQERVRNNYLTLKKYKNFKIINCSYEDNNQYKIYSPEEIFNKYINYIKKII